MFERSETDSKEPGMVKHSINTLMFRSLKRTHDLFIASQSLSIPTHEQSSKLRKSCKINSEYSAVKHLPPPNESIARIASKTELGASIGPSLSDKGADIPFTDTGNQEVFRGSTALVSARDNNPLKSALALKAITTEKPTWHAPWKLYRVISGHLGWVRCIDVDPSNDWFITGSTDRTIKIWDLATSTLRLSLTGHISTIRAVKVSHRHTYFFSAGEDKQIKCWDLEHNKTIRQYHGHLSAVYGLTLHPRLDVLISCGRDSTARVWDIRTKACIFTLTGHTNTVACVESQAPNPQVSMYMYCTPRMVDGVIIHSTNINLLI
ncbi:Pleiotropic regulator 1 [Oopsacas minuta]|uniref:Pleiotropic regulator 1 n=1 Tax=Oopsacas minuta TaxID=111878 RepID=A0AAV7JFH5_9METZ|nr:Pleiotropic regulator 1 [Oopsacas minuta]